jgi:hypothetical protein
MAVAVPYDEDATSADYSAPELIPNVPYIPEPAAPTPAPVPELTDAERKTAIKRSKLRLQAATDEVERLKPTTEKVLLGAALNLRESAAGTTKRAAGNLVRDWLDIVAPEKPHAPGSLKSILQVALQPIDRLGPILDIANKVAGQDNPNAPANLLRADARATAAEGSAQLRSAAEETERLGGGLPTQIAAGLGGAAGASAPALLAAPLGLPAAAVAAGVHAYGNNVADFQQRLMELNPKLTEQEARDKAMLPAAATAAMTALLTRTFGGVEGFIENSLTKGLTQGGIRVALRDVAKSALLEFPEEYFDQLSQGFAEKAFIDPKKSTKEIFDDAALAGLTGVALGGITTGGLTTVFKAGEGLSRIRRTPEGTNAQGTRKQTPSTSQPPPLVVKEAEGSLHLRNIAKDRLETVTPPPLTTTEITERAIERTNPKPTPPPLPQAKVAAFGGYLYDNPNLPSFKIPGVRPGIVRDVSADTARKLGYTVPQTVPTFEEWNAAGRPATTTPDVSFSPVESTDLSQRFPGQSLGQIAQAYTNIGDDVITSYPGGQTKFMHDLGAMAKTPQDVQALKDMAERGAQDVKNLMQSGDFDTAMLRAGRQPSEAYEYATGVKTDGTPKWEIFEKRYPGYVPPVPDAKYVDAKGVAKSPAGSPQVSDLLQQARSPVDWRSFSQVDERGYRVIDEAKLLAQLKAGQIRGGTASETLLQHLLNRSDLHPMEAIKLIDMTPEQVTELAKAGVGRSDIQKKAAASGAYKGLFETKRGSPVGAIEIVTREDDGAPITQQEFVRLMIHELVHNNVESKLRDAPHEVQQRAHDAFMYFLEKAQGTVWENHNASSSLAEFIPEAASTPGLQKFLAGIDYSGRGKGAKGKSLWHEVLDIIRNILKLPEFIITSTGKKFEVVTLLDEVMSLSGELESVQRQARPLADQVSTSPAGPPPLPSAGPPPLPGSELSAAQIAAGTSEVGRIAQSVYQEREQGVSALEGLAYERRAYQNARNEMRRLTGLGVAGFTTMGLSPEQIVFPDPTEGVTFTDGQISADNTFTGKLSAAGVPHNPENVRSMQEEIFYEQSAHRLVNLSERISSLQQAVNYYTQLGADPESIANINKKLARLETNRTKLASAELNGRTVSGRASEITAAESVRQERMAQRDALALEPVAEFFGKQVGAFRQFEQRAKAGLDLANALKANAKDPTALQAAMEEAQKWINIPEDIRNAIMTGAPLTVEQRSVIFSALGQVFEDFDFAYSRMREQLESKVPQLNKQIRELLGKVAKAKVDSGMGEVVVSDVLSALDGESGGSGNLKSLAETQALRERVSAIKSFAETLGKNLQTNQELFEWLVDPSKPQPQQIGNVGVDPQTLQMILNEVKRNPAFNSSVLTLIDAADKKLADMPITGLTQIKELLEAGGQENQQTAEAIGTEMQRKAKAQTRMADAALRDLLKQLDTLEIERRSLQEGQAMFEELAASPEFRGTRDAVTNSPWGLVEPMHEQNNVQTLFKGFGGQGLPGHAELVLNANDNPHFKAEWFKRVAQWEKDATDHVNAYDNAVALYNADPVNNPSPQQLGFDIPKVRGLRHAVKVFIPGAFQDLSYNAGNKRWQVPWLARKLSKVAMFRQHDLVARMVGGITGFDLRARLADFVNHYLIGQGIREKYRDIPDKLHSALRSHPELGMNIANYREHWNEMAHYGRQFPSPVRPGFVLPRTKLTVTAEDMALLQRERAYEEELRRRVTETNETQGIRVKTPTRTLVRPGAHVGEEGLPRYPNKHANQFLADSLAAYNIPPPVGSPKGTPPTVRSFGPTTNLGPSSNDPVVGFWNRNTHLLVQHILDSRRTDRTMVLSPAMQQAESDLMADWIVFNGVPSVQSLDDLVTMLVKKYPPASSTGLNPRDEVIKGLNAELRQYRDAAQRLMEDREANQSRTAQAEIAFTADNEFTRPAAKLELPSPLYDYGALSPGDHIAISNRSNFERILAYATSVNRAIAEIRARMALVDNSNPGLRQTPQQAAEHYGEDYKEMQDVLGILEKIAADFNSAYKSGSFTQAPRGPLTGAMRFATSAILALPTVGIRNMTQGQFAVYVMNQAMGSAGHTLTWWRAMKALPKTLIRFALHAADGTVKRTNLGLALLTGKNQHIFEDAIRKFGNLLTQEDFRASADKVGQLGLDGRESYLDALKRLWQESAEFINTEDQLSATLIPDKVPLVGGRRLGKVIGLTPRAIRAFFDKIGVQQYDFAINSTALNSAQLLAGRMKQVAVDYGKAREAQGLTQFDATNPAWKMKAGEWSTANRRQAEDNLAFIQHFLETSVSPLGFQLERSMWNYYQAQKTNPQAQLFTPQQMEAVQRRILADYNASTPANRPSAVAGNSFVRNILTLQGYPSDQLLKIINAGFGHTRDRGALANTLVKTPVIALMALTAVLIGYVTSAVTGSWEKYVRGRQPSLATPLDRDFWTSVKRWGKGTLALGAAQFGYIGDLVLKLLGEVRGNRGFDPTGRILLVSLYDRALNALAGAGNTLFGTGKYSSEGRFRDALVPSLDVVRSMVPFWLEAERALGAVQGPLKQAERVGRGEAGVQGLLEGKSTFQAPTYGPTTVVRRNLGEAVGRFFEAQQAKDQPAAEKALAEAKVEQGKLFAYHYGRYIEAGKDVARARQLAERDVWNAYQDINPVVAAMLGRRPTQAQYDLLRAGLTGERGRVFNEGIDAWKAGSMALFSRPGVVTREEVAGARGGGGGRGFALPGGGGGSRLFRFPSITGRVSRGVRVPAVSAVASRVRRAATSGIRAARRTTARRAAGPRIRQARIRQPSLRAPRTRVPRSRPSRSLVRRPRPVYAAA